MSGNARAWVLATLMILPMLMYFALGAAWLWEHHWLLPASAATLLMGIAFSILAQRWSKDERSVLPPLDWNAPSRFDPRDRAAWEIVEEEAARVDLIRPDQLSAFTFYTETGQRLAQRLAEHYHPNAPNPIEHVPLVELLAALELAADDLGRLCKQVPAGELVTPSHLKQAVRAANWIGKLNALQTLVAPIFSPIAGLAKLGARQWMYKPAWKSLQSHALRWFFQAYVNRLGTHLVELYSGRLAIGADAYRLISRRDVPFASTHEAGSTLLIVVAGAVGSGKTRLIELLSRYWSELDESRHAPTSTNAERARLESAHWVEIPRVDRPSELAGHDAVPETSAAFEAAPACDMLLIVIDGRRDDAAADLWFLEAWQRWFDARRGIEMPPILVVATHADAPEFGDEPWSPPYEWAHGTRAREVAVRARLEALAAQLPPNASRIVAVGLPEDAPFGIAELVDPMLAASVPDAERVAILRHARDLASRSGGRRLLGQIGSTGRKLWGAARAKVARRPA